MTKALKAWKRVEARSHCQSRAELGRSLLDGQRLRQQTWMPAFAGMTGGMASPRFSTNRKPRLLPFPRAGTRMEHRRF